MMIDFLQKYRSQEFTVFSNSRLFTVATIILLLCLSCEKDNNENSNTGKLYSSIDADGNIYKGVRIGDQVWMAENLKTTHFNNSTPLYHVPDPDIWDTLTRAAYCWYDNDSIENGQIFGALYNWYAVETGNLCPTGWHVSTPNDRVELEYFLGGEQIAGGKLKESDTTHWQSPNTGATNEIGFTALPAGYRGLYRSEFQMLGSQAVFWLDYDDFYGSIFSVSKILVNNSASVYSQVDIKSSGLSVRCVRNK